MPHREHPTLPERNTAVILREGGRHFFLIDHIPSRRSSDALDGHELLRSSGGGGGSGGGADRTQVPSAGRQPVACVSAAAADSWSKAAQLARVARGSQTGRLVRARAQ